MKECKKIKEIIYKKIEGTISAEEEDLLNKHISICSGCSRDFIIYLKIKENLKDLKYEELPSWFSTKLHNRLINEKNTKLQQEVIRKALFSGFYRYALSSFVVLVVVFSAFYYLRRPYYRQLPTELIYSTTPQLISNYEVRDEIPVGKESYLRVKITSKKQLKDVKVQIVLPKEITGDEKVRTVNWRGDLNEGENYIVLRIKSVKDGEYPLEITLRKNSKEKKFIKNVKITKI